MRKIPVSYKIQSVGDPSPSIVFVDILKLWTEPSAQGNFNRIEPSIEAHKSIPVSNPMHNTELLSHITDEGIPKSSSNL